MTNLLTGVARLTGVLATAIFDEAGTCITSEMQPPYEEVLIGQVLQQLEGSLDVYGASTDDASQEAGYFVAHLEAGKLMVRRHLGYAVLVVTDETVNQASVGVALNVIMVKLAKLAAGGSVRAAQPAPVPVQPAPPVQLTPPPGQPVAPDTEPVGTHVVKALLALFQLSVGPAAKTVLKSTMVAHGYRPRTLTGEQYPELVNALARRIHNKEWQENFLMEAQRLV